MMRGPMMQALLEDRFQLKTHRETREVSGYLMTVAKGGLKVKPTAEGSCISVDPTDFSQSGKPDPSGKPFCLNPANPRHGSFEVFDIHGIALAAFASLLHPEGLPVIDQTGVTGRFDIHLEWESGTPNTAILLPHTSAIMAAREQLGLRLEPGKGPHEVLAIDRVEKPSGN